MARVGEITDLFMDHHMDALTTLTTTFRNLRKASRLSVGKRGRGSAELTYLDAARFLITVLATDRPSVAVDADFEFSNLVRAVDAGSTQEPDCKIHAQPLNVMMAALTLDEAMAIMLEDIGTGAWKKRAEQFAKTERERTKAPVVIPQLFRARLHINRGNLSARLVTPLGAELVYEHSTLSAAVASVDDPEQNHAAAFKRFEDKCRKFHTGKNIVATAETGLLKALGELVSRKARYV